MVSLEFGGMEEEQRSPLWADWTVNVSSAFQIELKAAQHGAFLNICHQM
jgi:hypothetical protein